MSIVVQRPQHIKNAYSRVESFSRWERFLKTTASLSNLIPPCFYYPANYGSFFSVCFYSPAGLYGSFIEGVSELLHRDIRCPSWKHDNGHILKVTLVFLLTGLYGEE